MGIKSWLYNLQSTLFPHHSTNAAVHSANDATDTCTNYTPLAEASECKRTRSVVVRPAIKAADCAWLKGSLQLLSKRYSHKRIILGLGLFQSRGINAAIQVATQKCSSRAGYSIHRAKQSELLLCSEIGSRSFWAQRNTRPPVGRRGCNSEYLATCRKTMN